MTRRSILHAHEVSRRGFLGLTSAAAGLWLTPAWASRTRFLGNDTSPLSALEREHFLSVRLPARTRNGHKVPIVVEMSHPMTPDHHITMLEVVNDTDPIPSKGIVHFTPASGVVYVAFQARMDEGDSQVTVTADCNRHGRWAARRSISVAENGGGCSGTAPPFARTAGDDLHPPEIRIPELVDRGEIRRGEIIHPQVKIRHPNRTGLVERDGAFVRATEPLYMKEMEVRFGGQTVSRFEFTPALSDDPFITFALLASHEASLEVRIANNRGERFTATREIRFS
ncbi:MAG TPA: thiosulfate oxidation carrier complex protein SoxZ [Myxococcales bacterium]|nr:thiosulfate oxidation carrier complex protein SoxZ [Myxococcales bacterium]